ncbi:MAG: hypothetical protein LBJ20_00810 [Candidatus Methanoplasma sp.]|nr:hypothetical protein [Candidatus Methanoplasma sp.]
MIDRKFPINHIKIRKLSKPQLLGTGSAEKKETDHRISTEMGKIAGNIRKLTPENIQVLLGHRRKTGIPLNRTETGIFPEAERNGVIVAPFAKLLNVRNIFREFGLGKTKALPIQNE